MVTTKQRPKPASTSAQTPPAKAGSTSAQTPPAKAAKAGSTSAQTPPAKAGSTRAQTPRTAAGSRLVADAIAAAIPCSLPHSSIRPSPMNPRKVFEDLETLADSIKEVGILQRPLLRPIPKKGKKLLAHRVNGGKWEWTNLDYFEIVFGERRCRAAKLAGLDAIPVNVAELSDDVVKAIQIIENDARKDLRVSEQVAAYGQYAEEGKTAEEIQALTFRSLTEVRSILLLRRLPAAVLKAIDAGRLSRGTAELIARVPGDQSRALAAACVLAGEGWIDRRRPAPKPKEEDEPLSVRGTKELIRQYFQVELKSAPFSRIALDLVEGATSCDACPNMAGNAAKLDPVYKEVRGDTCLDPECFQRKVEAHKARTINTAKKEGKKFLAPKEAAKLYPHGDRLTYSAPYVDLDKVCEDDTKNRTYRTLLNGCLPTEKVVIALDGEGDPHELLDKASARSLLKQNGKIKTPPRPAVTARRKEEIRDDRLRHEIVRIGTQAAEAAAAKLPSSPEVDKLFLEMFKPLVAEFWSDTIKKVDVFRKQEAEAVAKLKGCPHPHTNLDDLRPSSGSQARGLLARLIAHRTLTDYSCDLKSILQGNLISPFLAALGVDLKRVVAQAQAKIDGKQEEVRALRPQLPVTPPTLTNKKKGKGSGSTILERNAAEITEQEWCETKLAMVPKFTGTIAMALRQRGISTIGDLVTKIAKLVGKDYHLLSFELHPAIKRVFEAALSGVDLPPLTVLYAVDAAFDYLNANPQPSLAKAS